MMTREELISAMKEIDELYAESDGMAYNSDERERVETDIFSRASAVIQHAMLCLHDIRETLVERRR